jgi:putative phage-type endonuclease
MTPTAVQICGPRIERHNRPRWLELRRQGIGGSDAAAIMGMDSYHTRWQLWLDKTGTLPDEELTEEQAEAIEWGHAMEPVIAKMWARRAKVPGRLIRPGMLAHRDRLWQRVNLDRLVTDCGLGRGPCLLECKNRNAYQVAQWGPMDTDQVPDGPAIQTQHALMVTGFTHAHLAAAIGGNHLRHYVIDADPALHELLLAEEEWFWRVCVLGGQAPPIDATERTGRVLARLWQAEPDKVVMADWRTTQMVESLRRVKADAADYATEVRRRIHELQEIMGDAEVLRDPETGRALVTWIPNGTFRAGDYLTDQPPGFTRYLRYQPGLDTRQMAAAEPETYRRYRARKFIIKAQPEES